MTLLLRTDVCMAVSGYIWWSEHYLAVVVVVVVVAVV